MESVELKSDIDIGYAMAPAEVFAGGMAQLMRLPGGRGVVGVLIIGFVAAIVTIGSRAYAEGGLPLAVAILGGAFLLVTLVTLAVSRFGGPRNRKWRTHQRFAASANTVSWGFPGFAISSSWAGVTGVHEALGIVSVVLASSSVIVLPRRVLSDDDMAQLRDWAGATAANRSGYSDAASQTTAPPSQEDTAEYLSYPVGPLPPFRPILEFGKGLLGATPTLLLFLLLFSPSSLPQAIRRGEMPDLTIDVVFMPGMMAGISVLGTVASIVAKRRQRSETARVRHLMMDEHGVTLVDLHGHMQAAWSEVGSISETSEQLQVNGTGFKGKAVSLTGLSTAQRSSARRLLRTQLGRRFRSSQSS